MKLHSRSRRRFVATLASLAPVLAGVSPGHAQSPNRKASTRSTPRVGIALGSGGAAGLAHVPMLETLDKLGVKPHRIAGSSIGAVVGALYAAGRSGADIRQLVERHFVAQGDDLLEKLISPQAREWIDLVEVELGSGGLLSSEQFIGFLYEELAGTRFEDLAIPLTVMAGDLWSREAVPIDSGNLLDAVRASMALPGVFEPMVRDGRTLIDGGTVNPVPYDLLLEDCDIVIAVEVFGERTPPSGQGPQYFETLFNSAKVMQQAIVDAMRKRAEPDLWISPPVRDIRALEFYRAEEVFTQAEPAAEELAEQLGALLKH